MKALIKQSLAKLCIQASLSCNCIERLDEAFPGIFVASLTVIRKGTFARYDYGLWGNLKRYGKLKPPAFNLADIPESLPLWMAYGGKDALADPTDVKRTIKGLKSKPVLLYNDSYGHIDFIMSVNAKEDVYVDLLRFFRSRSWLSSY